MLSSILFAFLLAAPPDGSEARPVGRIAAWVRPLYSAVAAAGTLIGFERHLYLPVGFSVRVAGGWSVDAEGGYAVQDHDCWVADGVCVRSETTTLALGVAYGPEGLAGWFVGPRLLWNHWSTTRGTGGLSGTLVIPAADATEWIFAVEGGYRWKVGHFHLALAPGFGAGISIPNQHHEFAGPFGGRRGPEDRSPQVYYVNLDLLRVGAVF